MKKYEEPKVRIIKVVIEKGFAASAGGAGGEGANPEGDLTSFGADADRGF